LRINQQVPFECGLEQHGPTRFDLRTLIILQNFAGQF